MDGNRCRARREKLCLFACLRFTLQINDSIIKNQIDVDEGSSYACDVWI